VVGAELLVFVVELVGACSVEVVMERAAGICPTNPEEQAKQEVAVMQLAQPVGQVWQMLSVFRYNPTRQLVQVALFFWHRAQLEFVQAWQLVVLVALFPTIM
jgi:hypothetical protein